MDAPPPRSGDLAALARLREALTASGYTQDALLAAVGSTGPSPTRAEIPLAERRLPSGERLSTLARLLLLELSVERAEAAAALAPLGVEGAEELGLVAARDGKVEPLVRITPSGQLYFASDRRLGTREGVMGVAPSSALLGNLTVRRPVERALDVGTGSGILAVLAAKHAEHVVATDLSERALAFAAFNAGLNGLDNIEFRRGSFFEPVAGERFGLVTSNPPFVISPDTSFTYRDSDLGRDGVSELVTREAPAHIEEGGFAHLLASWVHDPSGDWSAPVRAWLEGSGCDALILRYVTDDPLTYAGRWNPPQQAASPEELADALDRWVAHYRELGIEAVTLINASWTGQGQHKNGGIHAADAALNEKSKRVFQDALITETTIPACDASSKDPGSSS